MRHLRSTVDARYGRGVSRRPAIGQTAPRFELPAHDGNATTPWSLDDQLGHGRAIVLIFHRHIH